MGVTRGASGSISPKGTSGGASNIKFRLGRSPGPESGRVLGWSTQGDYQGAAWVSFPRHRLSLRKGRFASKRKARRDFDVYIALSKLELTMGREAKHTLEQTDAHHGFRKKICPVRNRCHASDCGVTAGSDVT